MLTLALLLYDLSSGGFILCWEFHGQSFQHPFLAGLWHSNSSLVLPWSRIPFRLFFMCLITHFIPFCPCTGLQFHMLNTVSVLSLSLLDYILCRSAFHWGIGGSCGHPPSDFPLLYSSKQHSGLHLTKTLLLD